ncbi:hypothetical protein BHE74_00055787, partial [Ensete ventricosum]
MQYRLIPPVPGAEGGRKKKREKKKKKKNPGVRRCSSPARSFAALCLRDPSPAGNFFFPHGEKKRLPAWGEGTRRSVCLCIPLSTGVLYHIVLSSVCRYRPVWQTLVDIALEACNDIICAIGAHKILSTLGYDLHSFILWNLSVPWRASRRRA